MIDQITVVLGVDRNYLPQLKVSSLTWAKYQPWLMRVPWVVFHDRQSLSAHEVLAATEGSGHRGELHLVNWPPPGIEHASQKEKMLAGFVHVPAETVQTRWWLKIDCDAICTGPAEFPLAEWFAMRDTVFAGPGPALEPCGPDAPAPVLIGSGWHYTKPGDQMRRLDDWADGVPGLAKYPRLGIPYNPGARTVSHPRYCSWLSFYSTTWSRWAASVCDPYRIPVDSQDGLHWYLAARTGAPVRLVKMKRHGWDNISRLPALRTRVAELLKE